MFCYLAIGYFLYRYQLITKEGSRSLANLLLYVSLPCVIIKSFCISNTAESRTELLLSMLMGLGLLVLSMSVSTLCFRKKPLENFSGAFSNAGFMGVPLITATLGANAVFYTAGMIALLNVFQWTYGQRLLSGTSSGPRRYRQLFLNPLTVSLVVGLLVFSLEITAPDTVMVCLSALAGLNAPLAMIVLGIYLAQTHLLQLFCQESHYLVAVVRLLLIPLLSIALLSLLPGELLLIKQALLMATCAPVGSNVAVFAQKLDKDYTHAVQLVCLSTILSIVTMPLILGLATALWT